MHKRIKDKCLKKGKVGSQTSDNQEPGADGENKPLTQEADKDSVNDHLNPDISKGSISSNDLNDDGHKDGILKAARLEADNKMAAKFHEEIMNDIQKEKEERMGFSENIIREFDMENLKAFYLRSKREQLDFWAFFGINDSTREYIVDIKDGRKSKIRQNFEDHCKSNKVSTDEVFLYDKLLTERCKEIEKVIEDHFNLIKEVIEEEKLEKRERDIEKTFGKEDYRQKIERLIIEANFEKDPDRQYSNRKIYTFEKMLQQLCDHQVQLIRQHKEHYINDSQTTPICRMKG